MKSKLLSLAIASALTAPLQAAEELEAIQVQDLRERLQQAGVLKDEIQQTEVITEEAIARKQAASVNEAIQNEPGVRVSNECSMCGIKRVMINGMKGEHTTVLVDGVPTHTMVSGFYGLDGVATAGVSRVEIARGAGASLIAPEAIGGTVNIVTKRAEKNGVDLDMSAGENGYEKYSLVGTAVSPDGRTRATVAGQYDNRDQEDNDDNGVNETPLLENYSVNAKVSHDLSRDDNVELRVLKGKSTVFGGPMLGDTANSMADANANFGGIPSFQDNDVRKRYTGLPGDTTEHIVTERREVVGKWLRQLNDDTNLTVTGMSAESVQDSFYEGIDYQADDDTLYGDVRINHFLNDEHLLTAGLDSRRERLRSNSRALQALNQDGDPDTVYISDSFDYNLTGVYLQDTWTPSDRFELAAALRLDQIEADFVDPAKPGSEIDETMISPRLHLRYDHNDSWTSRVQAGKGYRAPLSFFETDHGILDGSKGYRIEVDELEKSTSASYALSFNSSRTTATASLAWNQVDNLASLEEDADGVPVLAQLDDTAQVVTADLVAGYQLNAHWLIGAGFEKFNYSDEFKQSYAIAQIEERVRLTADYEGHGWNWNTTLTWIGSRDLTDYDYEGFNTANGDPSSRKTTDAPSYYTVDMKLSKELNKTFTAYMGVNNLFDYTQAGDEDTPLFYGDFNDPESYDVGYIYGPLRGRTIYAGLKARF